MSYTPILKWKAGEYEALKVLDFKKIPGLNNMVPLIEIVPVPWNYSNERPAKSIEQHLKKVPLQIFQSWGSKPMFVDFNWIDITEKLVCEMAEAGADLIELGIPFSDPVAEGIVIQNADERALAAGTTTDKIFDMVKRLRNKCGIPLAFMTYVNPIFTYGADKFLANCQTCGIDALIIPDLPFEEKGELADVADKNGVDLISMIAPTSDQRIQMIAKEGKGFLYVVSSLGVTGVRSQFHLGIQDVVKTAKASATVPVAVGFGINTPEQAGEIAAVADGVIVGSAIVKIIEEFGEDAGPHLHRYIKSMKAAL